MIPSRFLAAALLLAGLSSPLWMSEAASAQPAPPSISVSGEGSVTVRPDVAHVSAGVTTEGKTARQAAEANATQMTAIVAAAKKAGVADQDIRTSRYAIDPITVTRRDDAPQVVGYRATNTVQIIIRTIAQVGDVLDQLIAAGANDIDTIDFAASDPTRALDDARKAAFADAKRKADLYAAAAGAKVGRALTIAEGEGYSAPRRRYAPRAKAASSTPVEAGSETLSVQVAVTFELVP